MDLNDTQQTPADPAPWVHDLLRQVPGESMPEAVRLRLLQALRVEQDLRESSDFNPDADVEELEDLMDLDARDQACRASSRTRSNATDSS